MGEKVAAASERYAAVFPFYFYHFSFFLFLYIYTFFSFFLLLVRLVLSRETRNFELLFQCCFDNFCFREFLSFFFGKRTVSQPRRNFIFTEKKKKKKLAILGVASRKNCFGKSLKIFKKYARIDSLSSLLLRVGSFRNFTKIEMAAAARKREESRN